MEPGTFGQVPDCPGRPTPRSLTTVGWIPVAKGPSSFSTVNLPRRARVPTALRPCCVECCSRTLCARKVVGSEEVGSSRGEKADGGPPLGDLLRALSQKRFFPSLLFASSPAFPLPAASHDACGRSRCASLCGLSSGRRVRGSAGSTRPVRGAGRFSCGEGSGEGPRKWQGGAGPSRKNGGRSALKARGRGSSALCRLPRSHPPRAPPALPAFYRCRWYREHSLGGVLAPAGSRTPRPSSWVGPAPPGGFLRRQKGPGRA